jgi:hypothetical protein
MLSGIKAAISAIALLRAAKITKAFCFGLQNIIHSLCPLSSPPGASKCGQGIKRMLSQVSLV